MIVFTKTTTPCGMQREAVESMRDAGPLLTGSVMIKVFIVFVEKYLTPRNWLNRVDTEKVHIPIRIAK